MATSTKATSDRAFKIYENRLRRMAKRQGMELEKSSRRDPRAVDYGLYRLIDPSTNTVVEGGYPRAFSMTIRDVERYLTG